MNYRTFVSLSMAALFISAANIYSQPDPPTPPGGEPVPVFEEFRQMARENEDKILRTIPADIKEDLIKVKEIDKDKYYDILSGSPHFYFDLDNAFMMDSFEKKRIEQSQLVEHMEMHTEALGFLYQKSKANKQKQFKNKLRTKLEALFDLKEEERRLEVELLEEELKELKASLEVRRQNKAEIINNRMNELMGMDNYLDWD
jgi:hypothetical protein